jgi:hypothetical protein
MADYSIYMTFFETELFLTSLPFPHQAPAGKGGFRSLSDELFAFFFPFPPLFYFLVVEFVEYIDFKYLPAVNEKVNFKTSACGRLWPYGFISSRSMYLLIPIIYTLKST